MLPLRAKSAIADETNSHLQSARIICKLSLHLFLGDFVYHAVVGKMPPRCCNDCTVIGLGWMLMNIEANLMGELRSQLS